MKKVFVLAASLLVAVVSFGQAESGFSVSIGYDIEPYKYDQEDVNPAMLSGIIVRGDYEYVFGKHSGVSAGLRFDYIGLGDEGIKESIKTTWKKAYLDIPIKYNAHFGGFYLNAGPVIKFLLSYKHTETNLTTNESQTYNDLETGKFNKVYFGIGGGLGYDFKIGIRLFAEYDYIFTDVIKTGPVGKINSAKPSVITFGVGYKF